MVKCLIFSPVHGLHGAVVCGLPLEVAHEVGDALVRRRAVHELVLQVGEHADEGAKVHVRQAVPGLQA